MNFQELRFCSLNIDHFPLLLNWLCRKHVKQYWNPDITWNEKLIYEKYAPYVDGYKIINDAKLPIHAYVIYEKEIPIGYIQLYNATYFPREGYSLEEALKGTSFAHQCLSALDVFIGEENKIGKGLGSFLLKKFLVEHTWNRFEACLVDPDNNNLAAIKAYQKAGFVMIKDLPNHSQLMVASQNSSINFTD